MEAAQENQQPLLPETASPTVPGKQPKTPAQKAMRKTFKGTAHLANLLPTGTVLAFQILSPVVTDQGRCPNAASRATTLCLIVASAVSCFVCCFTDSVRDSRGKVRAEHRHNMEVTMSPHYIGSGCEIRYPSGQKLEENILAYDQFIKDGREKSNLN